MHTSTAQSHARPHSHHHAGRSAAAAASAATAAKPKLYNPRHPERTLPYQTIAEHFETWHELASAGQFDGQGDHHTPKPYVRQTFRKYLECGIFAHGFARAWCDDCGHDYFVAYSCKGRGVCPSCNTRRMVETAAHLTDHVFPRLPVRQWVLSVPKRLRYFMQRDGAVLGMVLRIFLRIIAQSLQSNSPGTAQLDKSALHIGAVAFIHRFGSSLNEHVHFHVCVVDGVFEEVPGEGDADADAQDAATPAGVIFHRATSRHAIFVEYSNQMYLQEDEALRMTTGEEITPTDSDVVLLKRIVLRDTAAMQAFYKRHANSVYHFVFRRMNDADMADEVVNDTLHQAWVSANAFAGQSSPKTWLLGIAKNKALDALRSKGRLDAKQQDASEDEQEAFADTAPGAYAQLLAKQQGQHLSQCFDDLPPEQRSCMHLSFVEGMTLAEIAQVMAIPTNTVATRIHHAKRKLRDCMECIFGKGEVL